MKSVEREDEIREAFSIFDPAGTGSISVASLLESMQALGEDFTEEQV